MTKKIIVKSRQECVIPKLKFYSREKSRNKIVSIKANFEKLDLQDKKFVQFFYDPKTKEIDLFFSKEKAENSYVLGGRGINVRSVCGNSVIKEIGCDVCGKVFVLKYTKKDILTADLSKPL